jgi:hypothetical protein
VHIIDTGHQYIHGTLMGNHGAECVREGIMHVAVRAYVRTRVRVYVCVRARVSVCHCVYK